MNLFFQEVETHAPFAPNPHHTGPNSPPPQVFPMYKVISQSSSFIPINVFSSIGNQHQGQGIILQLGPHGFILVGSRVSSMEANATTTLTRYPIFFGKGDEDVEQHWYLCEVVWRTKATLDDSKLVKFQTMLRGQALIWYMKFVYPQYPRSPLITLD